MIGSLTKTERVMIYRGKQNMKKTLAGLLVVVLLFCGLISVSSADTTRDSSAAFGVDMVIVLDMTNSMRNPYETSKGNDINNFRLDATGMLIGMLDMDRSRVAIVPFAGSPLNVTELQKVSDQATRDRLLRGIYDIKVQPRTNIGAALMKANQILFSREDKTNLPAIILMTDGNNSMTSGEAAIQSERVEQSWRWENDEIVNKGAEEYSTATAIQVTREAVDCAATLQYPIYTVALTQNPDETPDGGVSLRAISQGTGLDNGCWYVSKDNAQDLPTFFAEVLADKIGSSVQNKAKPVAVEGAKNTYQVKIPVLNKSVLETNIIIPVKSAKGSISSIDPQSIRVIDAEGTPQSEFTGVSVLYEKSQGHFALVKIREPRTTGMWTLQFVSEKNPDDVKFNILYNYDIQLSAATALAGQEKDEFYKNDLITIRSNFVDGNGNPSSDEALYTDSSENPEYEDWMKMKVNWELYQLNASGIASGDPVRTGSMVPDTFRCVYDGQIDLREETLISGNYHLIIHADGAGLNRNVTIPITLLNHEPDASDYTYAINVNSTAVGADSTWTVEGTSGTLPKKAQDIVTDKDHDQISFNLRAEEGVEQAADMELGEDGTIRFTTKATGEKGVQAGKAQYRLYYDDGDTGKGSIAVTLNIDSDVAAMLAKYEPEMTVTGTTAGSDHEFLKNTELTVTVRLKEINGTAYAGADLVEFLGRRVNITDTKNNETVASQAAMEIEGDSLVYKTNTGNKSAEWDISTEIDFFENPVTTTISIPNKEAPALTNAELQNQTITLNCDGEKVPSFLAGLIGTDTPEDDPSRDICTTELFKDVDNDTLIISDPVFLDAATGEPRDAGMISVAAKEDADENARHYLINYDGATTGLFNYSFTSNLEVTAKDGDGEVTKFNRQVVVVDLFNKLLTYLVIIGATLLTLIILFLIIHQIRKPRFPMLNMTIRKGTSYYESSSETLSPVKSPMTINSIGVGSDLEESDNALMELLQSIVVYPIRSTQNVGVTVKKAISGYEVMLADTVLKAKKKYIWRLNDELSIHKQSGDNIVAVKLEDRSHDNDEDVSSAFGSDDEWSTAGESTAATSSDRRHSRKVQRAPKKAEEETTPSSSTDDFDF